MKALENYPIELAPDQWNPEKELKVLICSHGSDSTGVVVESGEGIERLTPRLGPQARERVESGEGIESNPTRTAAPKSSLCVESGEGIESRGVAQDRARPRPWVESGEGIESSSPASPASFSFTPWNPEKELKVQVQ